MNCTEEIKQYITALKTKAGNPAGKAEQSRTAHALTAFCDKLQTWPEKDDYDAFSATLANSGKDAKFINEYTDRIKRFFVWLNPEKENDNMTDNNTNTPVDTPTDNSTARDGETTTPNKPGRKRFDTVNNEKKTEKIMLYLTPELIADVRDWCHVKRITANSFITGLIEEHLHSDKAQEKLAFFRKLSEDD